MKRNELIKSFYAYNSMEKAYKENYEKGLSSSEMGFLPPEFNDEHWFNTTQKNSVTLSKHDRYTPLFNHTHVFFEAIYVFSGICINTVTSEEITMTQGDFMFIPPGATHSIGVFDDSIIINILMRRKTFDQTFYDFLNNENALSDFFVNNLFNKEIKNYILFKTAGYDHIRNLIIDMFLEYVNNEAYSEMLLNQLIKTIFINLLRLPKNLIIQPESTKKQYHIQTQLIHFIYDNYKTVTLNDISKKFHYSLPYTSKIIKSHTGHSFSELLRKVRLEKAKELVVTSNLKICDISEVIGYPNVEHFIKLFKKTYNQTPSQYRHFYNKHF